MLLRLGCELGQGYGIARPMPAGELESWIRQWRPSVAWRTITPVRRELLPLLYAVAEHRSWNKAFDDHMAEGGAGLPQINPTCRFETWWHSAESRVLQKERASLEEAEALHRRIHLLMSLCVAQDEQEGVEGVEDARRELRIAVDEFIARILHALDA